MPKSPTLVFSAERLSKPPISLHHSYRLIALLFIILTILATPASLLALEALPARNSDAIPVDLGRLHFYLITVDTGSRVWDNFGHTALRVVDENSNTDTVFNWGLFDTSDGLLSFSFNFFKGIMNYQLGTSSPQAEFNNYRQQERTVWQDKLNLNNLQKEVLYRRLMWNIQPENIVYAYDYFDDNCTTRLRDYLDEALSGRISAATSQLTANSYRELVRYHYRSLPIISVSLDVLLNSNLDRDITVWEEMFLPLSLRARLMAIDSDVAIDGQRVKLLSDSEVVMAFPASTALPDGYHVAGTVLVIPVLFLFLLLRRAPPTNFSAQSRISLRAPGLSFRALGLLALLTSLFSGVYGCLMLGGWFFSGHEDLYNNWNLLLFWPTDLLGIFVAGRWILQAKPWPLTHNSMPFVNHYLLIRLIAMLLYALVAVFGWSTQALQNLLVFVFPGLFFYTILIWIVGFKLSRSRYMLY